MCLNKGLLAWFCLLYTSHEFCYPPCNFHFNILNSFEIIAKTLSVALEVSLSICTFLDFINFMNLCTLFCLSEFFFLFYFCFNTWKTSMRFKDK